MRAGAHCVCVSRQHLQKIGLDTFNGELLCEIGNKKTESSSDEPFDEDRSVKDLMFVSEL